MDDDILRLYLTQAPLLLPLFATINASITPFLYVFMDYIIALALVSIAEFKNEAHAKEVWPLPVLENEDSKGWHILILDNDGTTY